METIDYLACSPWHNLIILSKELRRRKRTLIAIAQQECSKFWVFFKFPDKNIWYLFNSIWVLRTWRLNYRYI